MPSANPKLEKQASTETADSPIRQVIVVIEHKIRNLEKRKVRKAERRPHAKTRRAREWEASLPALVPDLSSVAPCAASSVFPTRAPPWFFDAPCAPGTSTAPSHIPMYRDTRNRVLRFRRRRRPSSVVAMTPQSHAVAVFPPSEGPARNAPIYHRQPRVMAVSSLTRTRDSSLPLPSHVQVQVLADCSGMRTRRRRFPRALFRSATVITTASQRTRTLTDIAATSRRISPHAWSLVTWLIP